MEFDFRERLPVSGKKLGRCSIYLSIVFGQDVIGGRRPIACQLWSRLEPNQLPRPTLSANDLYYLGPINMLVACSNNISLLDSLLLTHKRNLC
jgi:hypothetical protein